MGSSVSDSKRAVAHIFNSAIAAPAIGAAWELGLLDELLDQNKVDVQNYAEQNNMDRGSLKGLASALATVGVVERDGDTVVAGRLFDEAHRTKSLFHWLCLGSGSLFSRMQYVLRNENRTGSFYSRDSAAIAYACREINKEFFDPVFWTAMRGLDYQIHSIVDLGCGSGRYGRVLERGFGDRLTFTEGDACALDYRDEFSQVDLLTCFLMGHDFWPRDNCIATLKRLRKALPNVRRFLLGDTTRILLDSADSKNNARSQYAVTEDDVPIFTLGFEFGHAMMGAFLPTIEDWEGVFAEGGWRCKKSHTFAHSLSVIFELEPLD
ncbi:hypothetical protein DL767_002371 [Monosporascus sp. MG133]|nr:hypothetical protein DL767_002371 [Monosporascus sp. MG133]